MTKLKKCSKCGETKPRTEFGKNRAQRDGYTSYCKKCRSARRRKPEPSYLRKCRVCGLEAYTKEDLELFVKHKSRKHGHALICKKCHNKKQRTWEHEHYVTNSEYRKRKLSRGREWRKKNPFKSIVCDTSARSKKRRLDFDLDVECLKQLWDECGGMCPMTGIQMIIQGGFGNPNTMSIDRIIPKKGYTKGNVRFVSHWYNRARNDWGDQFTLKMCQAVITQKTLIALSGKR